MTQGRKVRNKEESHKGTEAQRKIKSLAKAQIKEQRRTPQRPGDTKKNIYISR